MATELGPGRRIPIARGLDPAELADFVESASIGMHAVGPDGTILWANKADHTLLGYTRDEFVGRNIADFHADQDNITRMLAVLTRGERLIARPAALIHKDGSLRHVLVDSSGLLRDGKFVHTRCFTRDNSDRHTAESDLRERDAFLTRATLALLEASLDPDETMRVVARLAVEHLADAANVDILEGEAGLRRIIIAHKDPAKQPLADEFRARFAPHPLVRQVIASIPRGEARITNDFDEATIRKFVSDPEELQLALRIGYRHSLLVPLWGRSGLIGSLTLTRGDGAPYREEDAFVGKSLAARAALAYENALLHRAARDAEGRLRSIFENAPVQILTIDPDGRIDAINRSVTGRDISSIVGMSVYETVPPDQRERVTAYIRRALDGESADYEVEIDLGQGITWRHVRVAPRRDGDNVAGAVILSTDITDQKRAEHALAESEERFRTLVTATTNMVWSTDAAGMIVDMPEWRAFTGQTVHEVEGAGWLDAVHPEDRDRVIQTWTRAYDARASYEVEYRVRGQDGAYRLFLARAIPRVGADGGLLEYIGTWTDITEQRRAMQEAEFLRAQLVQGEKLAALGSLVSGVAHEIRTPLTYLANNLFLIERAAKRLATTNKPAADAANGLLDVGTHIKESQESIDRIERIVGDLRKYTRLKSTGDKQPMSLDAAIQDAVDLYRATHRGDAVVDAALATTPAAAVDRVQVQQVVLNLLQNAGEARSRGGRIRVRTFATAEGAPALEVSDEGDGIPQNVLERMWDPFFTTKPEGTGLGLSIVKRIVEAHGATISCESRKGEGTTFRVVFPRASTGTA